LQLHSSKADKAISIPFISVSLSLRIYLRNRPALILSDERQHTATNKRFERDPT
jgi:hypothetical protein